MNYAKPLFQAVLLASLTLTACTSATGEVDGQIGTVHQAALTGNALTGNALTGNALTGNALTGNALTGNALTGNALTGNALTGNALTGNALNDPLARDVLKYIVSCALPADEHVDITVGGVAYSYDGQLGLAPEWGEPGGHCGKACAQWVSGCVLSRLDFLGEHVEISDRGENPGLETSSAERAAYTSREATYYGNIFSSPQRRYACLAPGQTEIPRVCGPSIDDCVVDVVGTCDEVCGRAQADGSFPDCWAPDGDDGRRGHDRDDVYEGSVTVFLHP